MPVAGYDARLHAHALVARPRVVALAPQSPWIQQGTLRDAVLFGAPLLPDRYRRVLRACCLDVDLRQLPAGDATEIGCASFALSSPPSLVPERAPPPRRPHSPTPPPSLPATTSGRGVST